MKSLRRMVAAVAAVTLTTACHQVNSSQHVDEVKRLVSAAPRWIGRSAAGKRLWMAEQAFYKERAYLPAWIDGDEPTSQLDELLQAIRDAGQHGLDPADYGLAEFEAEREKADKAWIGASFDLARVPELDIRLTYAFLESAADLLGWRSSPRDVDRNWLAAPRKADLLAHLRAAIEGNQVRKALDALAPAHPQYRGLQAALARKDAQLDPARLEQLRMNLERWRWVPRDLGERHILINIASYQMQVIEGEKPVLAMRIIVGAPDTKTPLFSDEMTYVVFSPYWNIPENILREETLPRIARDPNWATRNDIEVVRGSGRQEERIDPSSIDWSDEKTTEGLRFRQSPGPDNALGLVKFIFPNHFNVYLHDTPTDALFNKPKRTFSHGCIRIEKPVALAEYVLRDRPEWTDERIAAAMRAREEHAVILKKPIPVHIGYWTAWVEEDGQVTFTDDPYGFDRVQATLEASHLIRNAASEP